MTDDIRMIDFHSHILPGMDDGSADLDESLDMLQLCHEGGTEIIVATPHFYAREESIDAFLERREEAYAVLAPWVSQPEVILGAEVYYYTGISYTEKLEALCVEGTDVLLLEMPFHRWSKQMLDEVLELAGSGRVTVLLAHINRYWRDQPEDIWQRLADRGVLFQVNAEAFLGGWLQRRRAMGFLNEGRIAVLGSDCHNMDARQPNLDLAMEVIRKKAGSDAVRQLYENALELLQ